MTRLQRLESGINSNDNRRILTDAGAEGPPDLVVEVLSPKTRNLDLIQKCRVYAREGVRELWILDPEPQTVLVYRFEEDLSNPVMTRTVKETLTSPLSRPGDCAGKSVQEITDSQV